MSLTGLLFHLLLGQRLPISGGTLEVPGAHGPVSIRRDGYGIPHIEAQGDDDAWYGLGFCQGQDRAFQLETLLRVTRGTLAELTGAEALPVDRLSRRIGFYRSAQAQLDALDGKVRAMLEAYARGVSDGAATGCRRRAHEFVLLRARPTPFTAADVLGVIKLMAFRLASNSFRASRSSFRSPAKLPSMPAMSCSSLSIWDLRNSVISAGRFADSIFSPGQPALRACCLLSGQ